MPGQSLGVDFATVDALGKELGRAVVEAAGSAAACPAPRVGAARETVSIPAQESTDDDRAKAWAALDLPEDAEPGTGELFAMEHDRTNGFPTDEKRERLARVRTYLRGRTASFFLGGTTTPAVEAQVLRIGPIELLALPAEATTEVGRDWRARRGRDAAVLSIANGWLRYLPHPRDFEEPNAHHGYEVLMSTLVLDAAERLLAAGDRLLKALEAGEKTG